MKFDRLGIAAPLVATLKRLGITEPTEIQTKVIPQALAGRNLIASAETGSGRTEAFLLLIIERMEKDAALRALILAPTRELAIQIETNAKQYSRVSKLRTLAAVGGESLGKQMNALRAGVDILIATPGRLNDLLERGAVR